MVYDVPYTTDDFLRLMVVVVRKHRALIKARALIKMALPKFNPSALDGDTVKLLAEVPVAVDEAIAIPLDPVIPLPGVWLPIATVARSERPIDLWVGYRGHQWRVTDAHWIGGGWVDARGHVYDGQPTATHWMPTPDPPPTAKANEP